MKEWVNLQQKSLMGLSPDYDEQNIEFPLFYKHMTIVKIALFVTSTA